MTAPDATTRFSSRVGDYVRFRPSYPANVVELLDVRGRDVADLGSGTGILTRLLLETGGAARVYAVEPNADMRAAAESALQGVGGFVSVDGTAEATTLPDAGVDLVTAAQAFHWFDVPRARAEALRILRPDGRAALVWNDRRTSSTPFLVAYEALLRRFGTDYAEVRHKNLGDDIVGSFFGGRDHMQHTTFANAQHFDFDGLAGRLLSSSYAPQAGHPSHAPMMNELRAVFDRYAGPDGRVTFEYDVRVFYGSMHRTHG